MIERYQICVSDVTQGGIACSNPTIRWEALGDVVIPCLDDNCDCVEIQVPDGAEEKCFSLIIDCQEECDTCPPQVFTYCLCADNGDCDGCDICIDGFCKSKCAPGQICDETREICVDECVSSTDCPDGKICVGGKCVCPPSKPYLDSNGKCKECVNDGNCDNCERCVDGSCVPVDCGTGSCDPDTGDCVECTDAGNCGPNETCKNNKCVCLPGFIYDPVVGECVAAPECKTNADCHASCTHCVSGECVPVTCPEGFICYNDECVKVCQCGNVTCNDGSACVNLGGNVCICLPCEEVPDCEHPACVDDNGNCKSNPCAGNCTYGGDCGVGCGCLDGHCYPCNTLDCGTGGECYDAYGCECSNGACIPGSCGNACTEYEDCAPGCACVDGVCVSCEFLSCANNDCANHPSCKCFNNTCVSSDPQCPDNDWYTCDPATYSDNGQCAKVVIALDTSATAADDEALLESEVQEFMNDLVTRGNTQVSLLGFSNVVNNAYGTLTSVVPVTVDLTFGGGNNYTGVLEDAYQILKNNQIANPSDGCKRVLVFFTANEQNSKEGGYGNATSADNTAAIAIANQFRDQGFEVIVVGYGASAAGDNCQVLTSIAGTSDNLILTTDQNANIGTPPARNGAKYAFDKAYDMIASTTAGATCRKATPADLAAGLPVFCGDDCPKCSDEGYGGYICTPHGCEFSPNGTLSKEQCCSNCEYAGKWSCDSLRGCFPDADGTYDTESSCINKCRCKDLKVTVSGYDCVNDMVNMSVTGPSSYTVVFSDGMSSYTFTNGQILTGIPNGTYTITVTDLVNPDCVNSANTITIDCCSGVVISGTGTPACGTEFDLALRFTGGTAPYSFTLYEDGTPVGSGSGLGENTLSGAITGLDSTNTYTVEVNYSSCTTTVPLPASLIPDPVVVTPVLSSVTTCAVDDTDIAFSFSVTGGNGPYTWLLYEGNLTADPGSGEIAGGTAPIGVVVNDTATRNLVATQFTIFAYDEDTCVGYASANIQYALGETCVISNLISGDICQGVDLIIQPLLTGLSADTVEMTVTYLNDPSGLTGTLTKTVVPGEITDFNFGPAATSTLAEIIDITVDVVSPNGCDTCAQETTSLTVADSGTCCAAPPACDLASTQTVNQGDMVTLSNSNAGVSYRWYNTAAPAVTLATTQDYTFKATTVGTTSYGVETTYALGCVVTCEVWDVTVNELIGETNILSLTAPDVCPGEKMFLDVEYELYVCLGAVITVTDGVDTVYHTEASATSPNTVHLDISDIEVPDGTSKELTVTVACLGGTGSDTQLITVTRLAASNEACVECVIEQPLSFSIVSTTFPGSAVYVDSGGGMLQICQSTDVTLAPVGGYGSAGTYSWSWYPAGLASLGSGDNLVINDYNGTEGSITLQSTCGGNTISRTIPVQAIPGCALL